MSKELYNDALALFVEDKLDGAEEICLKCLEKKESLDDELFNNVMHLYGFVKARKGDYDEAVSIYQKLLSIAREKNDHDREHIALHQIGMTKRMMGEFNEALDFFNKEREVIEDYFKDNKLKTATNYYESGYCNFKLERWDEALSHMENSYEIAIKQSDKICIACALRGLGEIYEGLRNPTKARQLLEESEAWFNKSGDQIGAEEVREMIDKL